MGSFRGKHFAWVALVLAWGTPYATGQRVLRAVVEGGTPAPSARGKFVGFGFGPAASGDNIVFFATTTTVGGVFGRIDGQMRVIADTLTLIPGTEITFGFAGGSTPSISGSNVAFGVLTGAGGAIWAWINGQFEMIADAWTDVPGGTGTFTGFRLLSGTSPAISGENVAFPGLSDQGEGIYARIDGELIRIADTATPVPGGFGTFQNFDMLDGSSPTISGENVAFVGVNNSDFGLYAYINGELRVIADRNTPVPGGSGNFGFPAVDKGSRPSISGENIAFASTGPTGIYAYISGELRLIADTDTPVPDGVGTFDSFGTTTGVNAWISGENVVFNSRIPMGVFAYIDGQLVKIADDNTPVPGHDTTFLSFGQLLGFSPAIAGRNVVFNAVSVEDGTAITGIYEYAKPPPIPAISTGGIATMVALLVLFSTAAIILRPRRRTDAPSP